LHKRSRFARLSVYLPRGCLGQVPREAAGEEVWWRTYGGDAATATHPLLQAVMSVKNRWEKSRHKLEYLGRVWWEQLLLMSTCRANLGGGSLFPAVFET